MTGIAANVNSSGPEGPVPPVFGPLEEPTWAAELTVILLSEEWPDGPAGWPGPAGRTPTADR
jgi:hypothetical protein